MKRLVILTCLVFVALGQVAFAGPGASGGGQAIVCRNDDGTVASADLLDLVEAQDYFLLNLQPQPANRPYLDIAHDYASILDMAIPSAYPVGKSTEQTGNQPPEVSYEVNGGILHVPGWFYPFVTYLVDHIDAGKMLIPGDDFQIPPVGDSHPLVLPSKKGCNIEQVALYSDGSDQVHFVGSVWNKLDNVNKAALLIHESLYRTLRTMGDSTSDQTRKAVGFLFSGLKFDWVLDGVPQNFLNCWTTDPNSSFQFLVYPGKDNDVTAQFLVYDGQVMLTKTTANLPSYPFAKVLGIAAPQETDADINTMANPLLDLPKYEFTVNVDAQTGLASSTIEAFASLAGKNPLPIACNSHLSQIVYCNGGGVTVGPVSPINPCGTSR